MTPGGARRSPSRRDAARASRAETVRRLAAPSFGPVPVPVPSLACHPPAAAARPTTALLVRGGPGLALVTAAVGRHRRLMAAGIGAGLLWTATKLAALLLVAHTVDAGVLGDDSGQLWLGVVLFAGLAVVGAGFAGLRRYYGQCLAYVVEADLRDRLLARVVRLPAAFHDRHPSGVLVARATTDLQQAQQPVINIPIMVSNLVMLVGTAILLARIDPVLTVVAMAPAVAVFAVAVRLTRRLGPRALDLQSELGVLASTVEESIAGCAPPRASVPRTTSGAASATRPVRCSGRRCG